MFSAVFCLYTDFNHRGNTSFELKMPQGLPFSKFVVCSDKSQVVEKLVNEVGLKEMWAVPTL